MDGKWPYSEPQSAVSTTECTGLVQNINIDEEQTDSYREIYNIPLKTSCIPVKKKDAVHGEDRQKYPPNR